LIDTDKLLKHVEYIGYLYTKLDGVEILFKEKVWQVKKEDCEDWTLLDNKIAVDTLSSLGVDIYTFEAEIKAEIANHAALTYLLATQFIDEEFIMTAIDGWRMFEDTLIKEVKRLTSKKPKLEVIEGDK